ncbi:MAG TPA: DUF58 domain-containing protein [Aggregatilineales bacterium]|nr:DUF58 domain-containing protein [Aggregatilineales bacterium]
MPERLFDEVTLRKLEQLTLVANRVRAGVMKGERRSVRRGTSIEFADYRNYTRGDDLRRIDWNAFARLERPFIKLFEEEEDLAVHILLDASGSMNWPREGPEADTQNKFRFAQRVAAGLGHISLGSGDRLTVSVLYGGERQMTWGPSRGRARTLGLIDFIGDLKTAGDTDLSRAITSYALHSSRPGLCLVISDLLSPSGYQDGIASLQARGFEVAIIHILSPDEVNPPLIGDLSLIDVETGQPQEVTVDGSMRDLYTRRLLGWREDIGTYCTRRGIHYATVETSTPWEELILYELRRIGVVH